MIHIVGLGGVGFWLTAGLARSIPMDQVTCWDDDTLHGGTGANRLPVASEFTLKVDLLRGYLQMVLGNTVLPTFMVRRFSGKLGVNKGDLIVDCTDMSLPLRKRVWGIARKAGAKLLRVSYDGRGSVLLVSTGLPLLAPAKGGYAAVPSFALSLAAGGIGAEAVKHYIDKPVSNFNLVLSIERAIYD